MITGSAPDYLLYRNAYEMNWLCNTVLHLFKVLVYSLCGALRALFPCRCRSERLPDFSADVCLVTGAGHGLGRLLAMKFAECGATMVLWDINEEGVRAVADEIREMGNEVFPYVCDCSKKEEVYRVAAQVKEEVGDVAVLVNNAGVVSGKKFVENNDASVERTFGVNTLSHFWTVRAFLPWMLENNYGYIVSISSVMAFAGVAGLTDYCASKAAAFTFAEALRHELKAANKNGITVTCVCPYHMSTGMFAGVKTLFPSLLRTMKPEEVAERTLRGVADRQFLVMIPRILYLLVMLKSILPTKAMDEMSKMMGADIAMNSFVGHKKKE